MIAMAEPKTAAAEKAAERAADKAAADAADKAAAEKRATEADEANAAARAAAEAEAAEVERANKAAQEAAAQEEASRPSTRAVHLAKVLEGFVNTNGQDVFDEALGILNGRQDAAEEGLSDEAKDAAKQRRSASKANRGAAPTGRTAPERKTG